MFHEKPLVWLMSSAVLDEHVSKVFFFSGEFRGKKNVAVAAADGQEAGRKCTTLMTNHDVLQPFNTCVTARKPANASDSRKALIIFLGQPIWGVRGGGVTRGEEINARAWTSSYFHALLFVWEPPFFLLFFFTTKYFFVFSHLSYFTHSDFCQIILAIVKMFQWFE